MFVANPTGHPLTRKALSHLNPPGTLCESGTFASTTMKHETTRPTPLFLRLWRCAPPLGTYWALFLTTTSARVVIL